MIAASVIPTDQDVADLENVFPGSRLRGLYERCLNSGKPRDPAEAKQESEQIRLVLQPFLLRVEVRLSTLHRTAALLLGGAAVMLLLPLFFPDAPAQLLSAVGEVANASVWSAILLAIAMGIAFGVPIWGFILIVADLTGFFFTGHRHDIEEVTDSGGVRVFNPRLGLSGLRAPAGAAPTEALPGWAYTELREKELAQLDVLLPEDQTWRSQFDDRMRQIFALERLPLTDQRRLSYAFRLAVSTPRPILDEVAKAELSLAKHILMLRIGLMRFIKTLLLVPVTVLTVIGATVIVQAARTDSPTTLLVELIAIFLLWGPLAAGAVGSPNRWIMRMSPGPGVVRDVYDDPRMVRFENGVVFLALVSSSLLILSALLYLVPHFGSTAANALIFIIAANVVLWVITKWLWWKGYLRRTPKAFFQMLKVGSH